MLCKKGVNGNFQDYRVLFDVLEILTACENLIKGE